MITEFFINEDDKIYKLEILKEYLKQLDKQENTILSKLPNKKELEINQNNYFIRLKQNTLLPNKMESFCVEIYDKENIIKEEVIFMYNEVNRIKKDCNFYIQHHKLKKGQEETKIITDNYFFTDNNLKKCSTDIKTISTEILKKYIESDSKNIPVDETMELIHKQGLTIEEVIIKRKRSIDVYKINKNIEKLSIESKQVRKKNLKLEKLKSINLRK